MGTVFNTIIPALYKKPYLKHWKNVSKHITKLKYEKDMEIQNSFINNLDSNIKLMSDHINELSNKKLDKYEFDNVRKSMDID